MAARVEEQEEGQKGSQSQCEETDAKMLFEQMSGPNGDVTDADERCGTDDELSDDQKPFFEAWVANANDYFDESLTEEDYSDLHTNTNPSQPYSPFHYEEDWDAEVLQNENPYDEEDLDDLSCGEHISPTADTLIKEDSYLPSLYHVAPVMFSDACNALHVNFEAGQFEDAEL